MIEGRGNYAKKGSRVFFLIRCLSNLEGPGRGCVGSSFPMLESSSGSPHVDLVPGPVLDLTSPCFSYSALWGRFPGLVYN